jgi:hypothetical protein
MEKAKENKKKDGLEGNYGKGIAKKKHKNLILQN